jgi:chromosome segregation ATPase
MPRFKSAPEPVVVPYSPPPKPPKPATRSVSEIAQARAAESAALLAAAEEVLLSLVDGQNPSAEERSLLVSLGLVDGRLDSELSRLRKVRSFQTRAGDAAGREQARQDSETAAAELARRGPEIDAELQRLQAERATLERTAEHARQVCERQATALAALQDRDLLPMHVQAELDDFTRAARPLVARVHTLQREIALTAELAALDPADAKAMTHAESAKLSCYHAAGVPPHHHPVVDPSGWLAYTRRRQAEDVQRQAEIEDLQAEVAPLAEQRTRLLGYYVR